MLVLMFDGLAQDGQFSLRAHLIDGDSTTCNRIACRDCRSRRKDVGPTKTAARNEKLASIQLEGVEVYLTSVCPTARY